MSRANLGRFYDSPGMSGGLGSDNDDYEGKGVIGDASGFKGERNPMAGSNPGNRQFKEFIVSPMNQLIKRIEQEFEKVNDYLRLSVEETLNFSAPATVPGVTDQTVTIDGVEMGDTVLVGCSIVPPTGFMPPVGFVSAANTVTVRWLQVTEAAADPDSTGAIYYIDVWRH